VRLCAELGKWACAQQSSWPVSVLGQVAMVGLAGRGHFRARAAASYWYILSQTKLYGFWPPVGQLALDAIHK